MPLILLVDKDGNTRIVSALGFGPGLEHRGNNVWKMNAMPDTITLEFERTVTDYETMTRDLTATDYHTRTVTVTREILVTDDITKEVTRTQMKIHTEYITDENQPTRYFTQEHTREITVTRDTTKVITWPGRGTFHVKFTGTVGADGNFARMHGAPSATVRTIVNVGGSWTGLLMNNKMDVYVDGNLDYSQGTGTVHIDFGHSGGVVRNPYIMLFEKNANPGMFTSIVANVLSVVGGGVTSVSAEIFRTSGLPVYTPGRLVATSLNTHNFTAGGGYTFNF